MFSRKSNPVHKWVISSFINRLSGFETCGDDDYKTRLYLGSTGGQGGSGGWECWQKNLLYEEMRLCLNSMLDVVRLWAGMFLFRGRIEKLPRIVRVEDWNKLNELQVFKLMKMSLRRRTLCSIRLVLVECYKHKHPHVNFPCSSLLTRDCCLHGVLL